MLLMLVCLTDTTHHGKVIYNLLECTFCVKLGHLPDKLQLLVYLSFDNSLIHMC